jgi:hypothetical protein
LETALQGLTPKQLSDLQDLIIKRKLNVFEIFSEAIENGSNNNISQQNEEGLLLRILLDILLMPVVIKDNSKNVAMEIQRKIPAKQHRTHRLVYSERLGFGSTLNLNRFPRATTGTKTKKATNSFTRPKTVSKSMNDIS